jgi:hypothetical protein
LTISNFSCSSLFIGGFITSSLKRTETTGITDGITGGDKPSNKKTETREITDGKTGGDKSCNERTETTGTTDG